MLRRVPCYGCAFCASLREYHEINVTFYSVTLAWTIRLPDDGSRTETCRSVFNVVMRKFYKFYICAVVGIIIE